MTYFVTGATGFLGGHFVQRLLDHREGDIFVLVRPGSEHKLRFTSDRVHVVHGDITEPRLGVDPDWIAEHTGQIEHFVHLAALYDLKATAERNDALNLDGTRHAVDFASAVRAGIFHHVSSIAVAGDYAGRFTEDMFDEGQTFSGDYHRTKFGSEKIVRDTAPMPWRVYRPSAVVGDSVTGHIDKIDGPYYFFSTIKALRDRVPGFVPVAAIGLGRTNVVPVDYVVNAMDELAHRPGLDGRAFHLANPKPQSNLSIMNAVARAAGAPRIRLSVDNVLTDQAVRWATRSLGAVAQRNATAREALRRVGLPVGLLPYVSLAVDFATDETVAELADTDLTVPKFEKYAGNLWTYWEEYLDPDVRRDRASRRAVEGKTVVVTGASSGIGRATAIRLGRQGARVAVVARSADTLDQVVADIAAAGGTAHAYPCDLTDLDAVDAVAKQILEDLGEVDVLVNNAGRSIRRSLRYSYDRFHDVERTIGLNYFGAVRFTMALLPSMAKRKSGHIVNVSSVGVQTYTPRFSSYVASKAALDAWSRVAATELHDRNVTFTSIHMPLVRTEMIAPTEAYSAFPAISPAQAADLVLKAIRERPVEINTSGGTVAEIGHAVVPRTMARLLNKAYHLIPESGAAQGTDRPKLTPRQRRIVKLVARLGR